MGDRRVYPASEDTFLLLEACLNEADTSDTVLEVGTGSGLIAQELKGRAQRIIATDINPHAVNTAHEKGVEVVRTNLYDGLCADFDLVVFNPPYLPTDDDERGDDWMERALDGGETGRDVIEAFLGRVNRVLADDGRVLLLVSSLTGVPEVEELAQEHGFESESVASKKLFFEELVVLRLTKSQGGSPRL